MKLDVTQALKERGSEFPFEAVQAIAPQQIGCDTVTFDDASLSGKLIAAANGNVLITGSLRTTAHARCANCLAPADSVIETGFEEEFVLNGDEKDDETFTYTGQALDLERLTTTCAILELPMRFLCREDCESFPDVADADIQIRSCQKELPGQRPFAALQQMLEEKSGKSADRDGGSPS